MSIAIETSRVSQAMRKKINLELPIKLENNKYNKLAPPTFVYPFRDDGERTVLPFSYATKVLKIPRPLRSDFTQTGLKFDAKLRPEQIEIKNEASDLISKHGSVIISAYCGLGKTVLAIKMSISIGFKTLIVVHTVPLMSQWEEEINRFCPEARVQKVTAKSVWKDADFYIINAQNAEKKGKDFFKDIGLVVVDEVHKIMAARMSKALEYVQPRYLLGLSATPYRPDGLDILLQLYFGKHEKVVRELWRDHIVYEVRTGIKPKIEKTVTGQLNWNVVLDSLCQNQSRNELIVKIIRDHPDRVFMVLTKRLTQGDYLERRLVECGESVTSLMRDNQTFDKEARVLIGTIGKIGTGFNHLAIDSLLLASDVEEYYVQYLGRCMRRKDMIPIVFDFVDSHGVLEKHYNTRREAYNKHGGRIVKYVS